MKHHFKKIAAAVAIAGYFSGLLFWHHAKAAPAENFLPEILPPAQMSTPAPHEFVRAQVSAYTSAVDETDESPHENARGTRPGPGSIACPSRYPFGTEVLISGKRYTCDDRMNKRYAAGDYFDIWFKDRDAALEFGRQTLIVEIYEDQD